ncbi:hypothetical protein [[Phormidium] sp. ETS-05]|uniref:hypothetical protein n=1 Tax=[Phormidium] sp. ETS-05 TaxID=222819 RepID=UPI0018EEEA19|nr:hypothetical protein [[Phormidium] sp. ETS-05]
MLWWVKTGQIRYRFELRSRLSRSEATIGRWRRQYRPNGLGGNTKRKRRHATPLISGETLEKLKQPLAGLAGVQ